MKRLDQYLVDQGLAKSRQQAQEKIKKGFIEVQSSPMASWRVILKPSFAFDESQMKVQEKPNEFDQFVSRAGLKLDGAFSQINLDISNFSVLDIGASTGGFTDCVLQRGARQVHALDVGHGQLHERLIWDDRVVVLEKINARDPQALSSALGASRFDLIVMDVSFISIRLILPHLSRFLTEDGKILSLVKPQFELGPKALNKKGIVTDLALFEVLRGQIEACVAKEGLILKDYFPTLLAGSDGNQEFFVFIGQQ